MQKFSTKKDVFIHLLTKVQDSLAQSEGYRAWAQDEANSHIGAMQSRYDTFKEEHQYLVAGYSKKIATLTEEREALSALLKSDYLTMARHATVRLASLVATEDEEGETKKYLITPCSGGETVKLNEDNVTLVTPQAPIGQALWGKKLEDESAVIINKKKKTLIVLDIS